MQSTSTKLFFSKCVLNEHCSFFIHHHYQEQNKTKWRKVCLWLKVLSQWKKINMVQELERKKKSLDSSVKTIPKPNTNAPACPHVTNLAAKVVSCAKLSRGQIPHGIMGDLKKSTSPTIDHGEICIQLCFHGHLVLQLCISQEQCVESTNLVW